MVSFIQLHLMINAYPMIHPFIRRGRDLLREKAAAMDDGSRAP
ncbi:hypothetical protein [Nannocystis pusilla]